MKNFSQINVENLFNKVEKFYKIFYINKLIKGIITSIAIIVGLFLTFNVIFYYASIPNWLRYGLFYGFIISLFFNVYYWILIPSSKLFRIKDGLSSEEAAKYIGSYFSEIGDKLVNTLQLHSHAELNELTLAALNQNSKSFEKFEFEKAVPGIDEDRRLWITLIPFLFFGTVWFSNSALITKGTERFVNYETDYSLIAPFTFDFNNQILVSEGEDLELEVRLHGEEISDQLWINIYGSSYRMIKNGNLFTYTLKNVTSGFGFNFSDGRFSSKEGIIDVIRNPILENIVVEIEFPEYLNKSKDRAISPSFLEIPKGSRIEVMGTGDYFENEIVHFEDVTIPSVGGLKSFSFKKVVEENGFLKIFLSDFNGDQHEVFVCDIRVIEDRYPDITVANVGDNSGAFIGNLEDDYGFEKLEVIIKSDSGSDVSIVPFSGSKTNGSFVYELDLDVFVSDVSVQFVVFDNDRVRGYKSTKSKLFKVDVLSDNELENELNAATDELKRDFKKTLVRSQKLESELEKVNSELMGKKELSWADEKKVQDLLKEVKSIDENLEELNKKVKDSNKKMNEMQDPSQQLLDKQNQIEDLLNKLMDDDTKKLLEELQKMLDELDKEALQEQLQELQKNQNELNNDLDRDLEILKQMEVERQFDLAKTRLDSLQRKVERELVKEYGNSESEEQLDNQMDLEEEFEELRRQMERMDSLNEELDEPNELGIDEDKLDEISEEMRESTDSMKNSDSKKGEKKQSEAQKKMEEVLEKMESSASLGGGSQEGEDLEALRRLLENLLVLSFDQESNMMEVKEVNDSDPRFVELTMEQLNLLDNSRLIRDSLNALSVRVPQIESTITKEVRSIESNMDYSISELGERRRAQAGIHQQKSLTSINNLAVLLDEIIQQMQEQQKNKNKGDGSCSKPGQGNPKPSVGNSKKKQEQLAKQIEKMKKGLEKGQKPGKMNPGQIGAGKSGEVAKLAAQQEQIRNEIRKMRDELQKEGNLEGAGSLKELEKMLDKNEEDLINLELDNEFFARQRDIEIKMLEAENATREREKEKKRESHSFRLVQDNNSELLLEYLEKKQRELELLRLEKVQFSGYYKRQVSSFENE